MFCFPASSGSNCSPDPCQNSGVCADTGSGYTCDCTDTGYEGTDCDTGNYYWLFDLILKFVFAVFFTLFNKIKYMCTLLSKMTFDVNHSTLNILKADPYYFWECLRGACVFIVNY